MLILQSSIVSLWLAWYNRPGSNIGRCPCPYFSFEVVRSIINFTKSTTRNDPGLIPTRSDMKISMTIEGQHLTISRDYVHSELPLPTICQIWHLFHGIALGVPNGTKLWCTDTGLCFHPEGGGIGQFWKIWGLISHLHVCGTILCQFKNPLDMPSYLDLIVSRFSSWNI